jgi:hypothetical protein
VKTVLALIGIGLLLAMTPAQGEEVLGRVRALYAQAANGVLLEASLAPRNARVRWADVEVDGRMHLVRVPAELLPRVGDWVGVRLGEPRSTHVARVLPTTAENRALRIESAGARVADSPRIGTQ